METEKCPKRTSTLIQMILAGMNKKKKNKNYDDGICVKNNRILISVDVVGSFGLLRLVVNENDKVSTVIEKSLKMYARGRRLPVLGSDFTDFAFYASNTGPGALDPDEEIGSWRGRNFVLCRKKKNQVADSKSQIITPQLTSSSSSSGSYSSSERWMACLLCLAP